MPGITHAGSGRGAEGPPYCRFSCRGAGMGLTKSIAGKVDEAHLTVEKQTLLPGSTLGTPSRGWPEMALPPHCRDLTATAARYFCLFFSSAKFAFFFTDFFYRKTQF